MFEETLIAELKKKLPRRTGTRHRLNEYDQDWLFVQCVKNLSIEDRLRLLRVCAMRGYIDK